MRTADIKLSHRAGTLLMGVWVLALLFDQLIKTHKWSGGDYVANFVMLLLAHQMYLEGRRDATEKSPPPDPSIGRFRRMLFSGLGMDPPPASSEKLKPAVERKAAGER